MPAWIFRRAKSLDLCGLQRTEPEQVVSYPSEAQKYLSIVPYSTEKAGKKFLTSYPLSVAIRMAATLFQLIVDTVLSVATLRHAFVCSKSLRTIFLIRKHLAAITALVL